MSQAFPGRVFLAKLAGWHSGYATGKNGLAKSFIFEHPSSESEISRHYVSKSGKLL